MNVKYFSINWSAIFYIFVAKLMWILMLCKMHNNNICNIPCWCHIGNRAGAGARKFLLFLMLRLRVPNVYGHWVCFIVVFYIWNCHQPKPRTRANICHTRILSLFLRSNGSFKYEESPDFRSLFHSLKLPDLYVLI